MGLKKLYKSDRLNLAQHAACTRIFQFVTNRRSEIQRVQKCLLRKKLESQLIKGCYVLKSLFTTRRSDET